MKAKNTLILLLVLSSFLLNCSKETKPEIDRECRIDISFMDFTFGIDHDDPAQYLIPGEQSNLSDVYLSEIRDVVGIPEDTIVFVLDLCDWINQNFTFENAGGGMIGIPTVDELYESKVFYGCHSQALLVSSILREFGFPAVLIETFDVGWAYDYFIIRSKH